MIRRRSFLAAAVGLMFAPLLRVIPKHASASIAAVLPKKSWLIFFSGGCARVTGDRAPVRYPNSNDYWIAPESHVTYPYTPTSAGPKSLMLTDSGIVEV